MNTTREKLAKAYAEYEQALIRREHGAIASNELVTKVAAILREDEVADDKVDVKRAAKHVGMSVSYMNKMRLVGGGPIYSKLGQSVRYRLSDLDKWDADRRRTSTSDDGSTLKHAS